VQAEAHLGDDSDACYLYRAWETDHNPNASRCSSSTNRFKGTKRTMIREDIRQDKRQGDDCTDPGDLTQNWIDHVPVDISEAKITTCVTKGESSVIQSQRVQHGGM